METINNGNCLLIYGGGLCDPANLFMRLMADKLTRMELFDKVFVGFYSFEAMLNENFIKEWNDDVRAEAENAFGGYFGTCRDVNLATDSDLANKAKEILKKNNIQWVFVGGGDGSARQCAEIANNFKKDGIKVAFVMPCTIDGIEGSMSIGLRQAVKVSCKIIEQLSSTCLNTRSNFTAPGLIVETQGRNRDDILAGVTKEIHDGNVKISSDVSVIAIPANYDWNSKALVKKVNSPEMEQTPVLILLSEGASIKRKDLKAMLTRKVRSFEVAHLSQVNGMTDAEDVEFLNNMLESTTAMLARAIACDKPFSIAYELGGVSIQKINYYAQCNPKNNQKPTMNSNLEKILDEYTIH